MEIVCISDTHGLHAKLDVPNGDLLIHAGDFMRYGDEVREIVQFNNWLGKLPHRHKIVVAGNHDTLFERSHQLAKGLLSNAIYLENTGIVIDDLKIWGSPVQPEFNNWAFNVQRGAAIRRYWDMIPGDTDILITHTPPFGILDVLAPPDHLGCEELMRAIERIRPALNVFGHIHTGYGCKALNGTMFINAAVLSETYQLVNDPITFCMLSGRDVLRPA